MVISSICVIEDVDRMRSCGRANALSYWSKGVGCGGVTGVPSCAAI